MPENRVSDSQKIISLFYHNRLSLMDIARRYHYTERFIAEVLTASTLQKCDDCFTVESIINYVKHF